MQASKLLKELAEMKTLHQMGLQKAENLERMLLADAAKPQTKLSNKVAINALARRKKHLLK